MGDRDQTDAADLTESGRLRTRVSELEQALERLQNAPNCAGPGNETYRRIFQHHSAAMYVFDPRTLLIIDANEAALSFYGYSREEFLTKRICDLNPLSEEEIRKELVVSRASGRNPSVSRHRLANGDIRNVEINANPVNLTDRQVYVSTVRDITERIRADEPLRQSEEKYRLLVDNAPLGILFTDADGQILEVNRSLLEMLGSPSAEATRALNVLTFPLLVKAGISDLFRRCMEKGEPQIAEVPYMSKWGKSVEWRVILTPVFDRVGAVVGCQAMTEDITERKRLEEQLRHAVKMEAIGRLAGGVAHDFNNLLTAMIGNAGILLAQMDVDDPRRNRVAQISFAAERAAELTRQLLAFSRKQVLAVKVLDLNDLIEGFTKILRRLVGEDITIVPSLDPSLATVSADPSQLEQILMNLAVNARDAMPMGGTLTIETANVVLDEDYARTHAEVREGPYVMFAVGDTGVGMEDETLSHLFDPFFTTKEKGRGTGLGLSTVFGIVKQHQGHISVYSEPGLGSIFRVYLPSAEEPVERVRKSHAAVAHRPATETLLVVEDEGIVRTLACELLEMLGYSVLSAANPEEALKIAEAHQGVIHLLLTDVVLPQMDGMSLFGRLSPGRPEMKVLYVSGYTQNFIVHHGVLRPGVHFLQKPFTLDSLGKKVREVLDEPEGSDTA